MRWDELHEIRIEGKDGERLPVVFCAPWNTNYRRVLVVVFRELARDTLPINTRRGEVDSSSNPISIVFETRTLSVSGGREDVLP